MKAKPTSKKGGVVLELAAQEKQIPATSGGAPFKLRKILVPVDFSDCSKKALLYAIPFARQFNAELILFHVVEACPAAPDIGPVAFETLEEGTAALDDLRRSLRDSMDCKTSLRSGTPYLEIVKLARELSIDLIIISTHGHKGLTHFVFGSTTEKVVRYAPCPVLIVRETERQFVPWMFPTKPGDR